MAQLHPDTLLRQWQMLRMVPRYPQKITAKALHEKLQDEQFDVTKRTVERDLLYLSEMFPLASDERDKPYGWSWSKDAPVFNLPGLSHNEALTLAMVEQHLNSLLPSSTLSQLQPYFKAARQHLSNIPQNERARSWLNKVRTVPPSQPLLPPSIKPAVQYTVYEALLADKQLEIKYLKRGEDKAVEYRIQSATMLEEAAKTPVGFSIDEAINSGKFGFGEGKQIRLEAIFCHGAGDRLFETPLSSDQTLTEIEDGNIRLIATVADTPQLGWWLLGLGDGVEVIKPAALRQSIAATIARMQAKYE